MTKKEEKLFVWDFHGTLEHGNDRALTEITNHILEQHGFERRLSVPEAEMLTGKGWHEYFEFLLPGLDYDQYLALQTKCISMAQSQPEIIIQHIKSTPYAVDVLEAIHQSPHTQIVLSNTQPKSLDIFLKSVQIDHFFPQHHRIAVDITPKMTKKEWLCTFLRNRLFPGGIVAIGDSLWDVELASCHPKGVGYLYAHPHKIHREADCHHKIHDLRHILQELL